MPKVTILDNAFATLWYHPEKKIVHHVIHKFIYGEEFKKLLLTGTETLKKNGAKKWLSNDKSNTVLRTEDTNWGQENWFPQTIQAGWKYWAIVQPAAAIAQMNMEKLVKLYSSMGITAKFFSDENEAMKWLESQ
jgi:hypothetical protein